MGTTTEDIKARLNIVELIGQYARLQKSGAHWKANCPFHQEKTPSFMVNEEKQMWHCFGCGKGGDAFAFIMEIEGLEFKEALRLLAERAGVELPQYRGEKETDGKKDRSYEILELSTKFYEKQLWESAGGKKILEYLHGRGLSDESIQEFRLGFAPEGWQHLSQFLLSRGYEATELETVGLALPGKDRGFYDRFRDRVMFPIMDLLGRVIGYSARVAPGGDETQAKYINTPETPVYHKSRALYGIQLAKQAMKAADIAVLVEGNMDVVALHQAGVKNAVAVSGTALTHDQLGIIKRYAKTARLFFDMDAAGQAAAKKSAEISFENELAVEVVALPFGKDAADMGKDDPDKLRAAVAEAKPAMEYFLSVFLKEADAKTPAGKRVIAERAAELLASMKNDIERGHWVKELAGVLDTEERVVRGVVEKVLQEKKRGTTFAERSPAKPFLPKTFDRRSEVLREGIVGLMFVGKGVREIILEEKDPEVNTFLSLHPLYFFLQNASADPIALIEDKTLQQEASRLLFQALDIPSLSEVEEEVREEKAKTIALEYRRELRTELTGKDKMRTLGVEIEQARKSGDKAREKELLQAFAALTSKSLPTEK
ncbi:MAG: DNA primase [Candidatus Moraniibacteriota bacterium]